MSKGKGQALGSIFGTAARKTAKGTGAAPAAPPETVTAFLAVVDRVEAVLDAEIDVLTRQIPTDISEIGNRKRQGLLEMSRALKAAAAGGPRPEVRERLGRFAAKVEQNRAVLGTQLRAVREIADIIAQTLLEAESDGTYSPVAARQ